MQQRLGRKWVVAFLLVFWIPVWIVSLSAADGEGKRYFVFSPDGRYLAKVFHTSGSTRVRIHETGQMEVLTQWSIPDFKAHTVRFSSSDPAKLLLADNKRLLVYRLVDKEQKLTFFRPEMQGQEIVQAYFDRHSGDIVWATKSVVYTADTNKKNQKEMIRIPWETGSIKSVAAVGEDKLAVVLNESKNIQVMAPGKEQADEVLKGHDSPIVGITSQGDDRLMSIDSDYQLILWNVAKGEPERTVSLVKPTQDAELKGFSLNDSGNKLQVLSQTDQETIGQRYAISDLESGKAQPESLPMTLTTSGNVYSSENEFGDATPVAVEEEEMAEKHVTPLPPRKQKNTLYTLAEIEFENGNYHAALELIKKIPLDDPEFKQSRELKRQVFATINAENTVAAAREQIKQGNYKSARILLENELSKNPNNKLLTNQLQRVENKLDDKSLLKFGLIVLLFLLIGLLILAIWYYRYRFLQGATANVADGGKVFGSEDVKRPTAEDFKALRRKFVYKLDDTRKQLNKAAVGDRERRFKATWMEITARLNTMEKRAKATDRYLADFLIELDEIIQSIDQLDARKNSQTGYQTKNEETSQQQKDQQQENKKESAEEASAKSDQKQSTQSKKGPDYHTILGVGKNAGLEEVKQAYRRKMKEYHPDRHTSSEFTWVKEEADKRTREVQEAYVRLSEKLK